MKKIGKTISIFCALLMVMSLMAGCGTDKSTKTQKKAVEAEEAVNESTGSEAGEIGEDAALEIAFKDAGLSESDVERIKCELDYDDGRTEYEVEFIQGTTEYEYTIDAFSGEILERDIDNDDD